MSGTLDIDTSSQSWFNLTSKPELFYESRNW